METNNKNELTIYHEKLAAAGEAFKQWFKAAKEYDFKSADKHFERYELYTELADLYKMQNMKAIAAERKRLHEKAIKSMTPEQIQREKEEIELIMLKFLTALRNVVIGKISTIKYRYEQGYISTEEFEKQTEATNRDIYEIDRDIAETLNRGGKQL